MNDRLNPVVQTFNKYKKLSFKAIALFISSYGLKYHQESGEYPIIPEYPALCKYKPLINIERIVYRLLLSFPHSVYDYQRKQKGN